MDKPSLETAINKISEVLIQSVRKSTDGIEKIGVSFSGGLDSSFLVYLLRNYTSVKEISLITACFPGTYDVENSKHSAKLLGLESEFYFLDQNILTEGIEELSEVIGTFNPIVISYMLPLYFVCKNSTDEFILLGQGSDELFGGYHWQQDLEENEFIRKTRKTVVDLLIEVGKREKVIAKYFQKELIMPYLDRELIDYVLPLPKEYRAARQEKYILRLVAERLGLPEEISWKKKKAAQYGSGIMREMKKTKGETKLSWR